MSETFGERLKATREKAGLTQSQLAERMEVSDNHLSALERDISEPRADMLRKLSVVLGVTTDYLLFGKKDADDPLDIAMIKARGLAESERNGIANWLEAYIELSNRTKKSQQDS